MRNLAIVVILIISTFSITACGSNSAPNDTATEKNKTTITLTMNNYTTYLTVSQKYYTDTVGYRVQTTRWIEFDCALSSAVYNNVVIVYKMTESDTYTKTLSLNIGGKGQTDNNVHFSTVGGISTYPIIISISGTVEY